MKSFILSIVIAIVALMPASARQTQTQEVQRTVTVSGESVVRVLPDQAIVRFGIVSRDRRPEKAQQKNDEASRDAMNAVRKLGIEERKMRLQSLQLQPDNQYNSDTQTWEQVGFIATREVEVTLDDLDLLPSVVQQIVAEGANRLNGVRYGLADDTAVRVSALEKAALNAKAKASLLATTLDATLGPVLTINEQGVYVPRPDIMLRAQAMEGVMADMPAPPDPSSYAAGEIEVRATVNLVFSLK